MVFFKIISDIFKPRYKLNVGIDTADLNKPAIVMLHGIAATSITWKRMSEKLMSDYRIIAIDLLGFGNSPTPKDCNYNVDDHVRSVRQAIKKLNIKKSYILVGHSMGSIVALKYTASYQKEIKHLYLMSIPVYQKEESDDGGGFIDKKIDIYRKVYKLLIDNKKFTLSAAKNLRALFGSEDSFGVQEENWHSFRESLIQTIINQDTMNQISKVYIPVDVMYGSLDTLLISDKVDKLGVFKNVRVTKIPLVGHFIEKRYLEKAVSIIQQTK